ncbi:MAG: hypothetical protein QOF40_2538 [Actinomycetota bacterium]|nr:hypothetical protein [Actinomycetota bacterium]
MRQGVSALRGLIGASSSRRSAARTRAAWSLAIGGPALAAVGMLPFRSSLGLPSFLFTVLLLVVAASLIGGIQPAAGTIVTGAVAGTFVFVPPFNSSPIHVQGQIVSLIAFVIVGTTVGILVDELTRLAEEQAALRRVATLAARGEPPAGLVASVAEELGRLLPVERTYMGRHEPDGSLSVVAAWTRSGGHVADGTAGALPGDADPFAAAASEDGFRSSVQSPITVDGHRWGVMFAVSSVERMPAGTEARLADLTDLLAIAIANAESRAELAASRARVVAAADETRRRIERDLHDGAQQRLVSLALELRAAQSGVPPEQQELRTRLTTTARGLNDVVTDLQELSRGIHPAILSKGGLGPALKTLVRRSTLPVELELRAADRRLPEPVEVAAYYIVSEALTNTAKHAHASVVQVDVSVEEPLLVLTIRDDGVGGADARRGSGLIGLQDRVETLGGTIEVAGGPGHGTTILARIPIDDKDEPDA